MENKAEDEIQKKWELEAKEKAEQERTLARPRKRLREIQYNGAGDMNMIESGQLTQVEQGEQTMSSAVRLPNSRSRASRGGKSTATRVAATRARGRVTEIVGDEDTVDVD
jgi:hypothetical protein